MKDQIRHSQLCCVKKKGLPFRAKACRPCQNSELCSVKSPLAPRGDLEGFDTPPLEGLGEEKGKRGKGKEKEKEEEEKKKDLRKQRNKQRKET